MKTIDLEQDGEPLVVRILSDAKPIAQHIVHAVGPNGSLAYFKGGPRHSGVEYGDSTLPEQVARSGSGALL